MRKLNFPRLWAAVSVLLMAFTLWMFLKPIDDDELVRLFSFANGDKLLHVLAFCGIVGWFASLLERKRWGSLLLCALLYGVLVEIAQWLMPFGRNADPFDVVADAAGMVLGLLAARSFGARWLDFIDAHLPGNQA